MPDKKLNKSEPSAHTQADGSGAPRAPGGGFAAFLADVEGWVQRYLDEGHDARWFVVQIGERYANIRLHDVRRPLRFLGQMAGAPPLQFGVEGFRHELVDDLNPARHYTAFVFTGYWLPRWVALLVLWLWEMARFVRYRGHWSRADMVSGQVGVRHGRLVARYGPTILPGLMAADLGEPEA
jgi:hypothetical protein